MHLSVTRGPCRPPLARMPCREYNTKSCHAVARRVVSPIPRRRTIESLPNRRRQIPNEATKESRKDNKKTPAGTACRSGYLLSPTSPWPRPPSRPPSTLFWQQMVSQFRKQKQKRMHVVSASLVWPCSVLICVCARQALMPTFPERARRVRFKTKSR